MKQNIPYRSLELPRQLLVVAFFIVGAWYLTWRPGTFNPGAPVFSWLIYSAELFGFSTALLHIFMSWRLSTRRAPPPRRGLSIDVFVPTYNESVDLVRKTLLAAHHMDYPHRTWLLDDGRRDEMRMLAAEIGCGYLTRGDNRNAKAGNLNSALAHTNGELIAIFDADHAPRRDFLLKTLGYFDDEKVGFVQTPQDYFNLDSFQHRRSRSGEALWTEQALFFRVIQRGKDCWNAAFFCGSCALIRRSALARIGGFATGTVTEDLHTSLRLHAAGFRSVYHAETLAFGVAPESIAPFIGQRIRWGQGAMHVWRKEGILTHRGLTLAQRLNYLASVLTYFDGWQKAIFYIAPVVVLTTGTLPLLTSTPDFLLHFVPYYMLTFWVFEEVGRGYGSVLFIEQYNMTRFAAFAWATLAWVFPAMKFRVTSKGSPARRALRFTAPQWVVMVFNAIAIPIGIAMYLRSSGLPLEGLVANVTWASVNSALALAVLMFTAVTQKRKRAHYRFPIPLPATLDFQGRRVRGTIDDISDTGMRFYGSLPPEVAPGSHCTGWLTLPDGPLEFSGEVRALLPLEGHEGVCKGVGCTFSMRKDDRQRLELFLFGSDLQWAINGYSDQVHTPLSRLMPARLRGPSRRQLANLHWNAAELTGTALSTPVQVLVSIPARAGSDRWLASFCALPDDHALSLEAFSRTYYGKQPVLLSQVRPDVDAREGLWLYSLATAEDAADKISQRRRGREAA